MNRDSGFGSFLAGVVIGGFVGAAVGLLLAPQSGNETREALGEFVDEKRNQIGEAINEGRAAAARARGETGETPGQWDEGDAATAGPAAGAAPGPGPVGPTAPEGSAL